mmetsp:Transcript_17241/g.25772  ORF Transcript_17241/g.25772 Transcript_17241/m.25772 type:complete len:300 (-) Transcript_17241:144-1043(-)
MSLICSLQSQQYSYLTIWMILSLLSTISLLLMSSIVFYYLYYKPTYSLWQYKINPSYPTPYKIQQEIITMLHGVIFSTICPALSIYFYHHNIGWGYCGIQPYGYIWLFISCIITWILSDMYEFLYHYLGHTVTVMWRLHKGHHSFYNPTPFAVIADNPIDQFFRAAPLCIFPLLFPVNLDMIFTMFSLFFFLNGLIQHSGYEISFIDGHSKWILTSYHHYLHHAKSTIFRPIYNGQLLQVWDQLLGATYSGACLCSRCARQSGERSIDKWNKTQKPDYSVLLSMSFWLTSYRSSAKSID